MRIKITSNTTEQVTIGETILFAWFYSEKESIFSRHFREITRISPEIRYNSFALFIFAQIIYYLITVFHISRWQYVGLRVFHNFLRQTPCFPYFTADSVFSIWFRVFHIFLWRQTPCFPYFYDVRLRGSDSGTPTPGLRLRVFHLTQ
jgi:hypothetical protein